MEKIVYREGISTTIDTVRARLTPRTWERLKTEAGIDEKVSKPSYPIATFDNVTRVLADELFPGRSIEDASFQLGLLALKTYGDTVMGGALFAVIRLLGPLRIVKRLPSTFRQFNNYADVKVEITSERSWELDHNEVGLYPHLIRGNMQSAGELFGWKGLKVELTSYDGHRARYRVSWESP
ncbi:MAG: DUF2378 family protein [Myxococcaceae bacterium]|nr:DUF2378 family protein [Myxococcaceae bacterium]